MRIFNFLKKTYWVRGAISFKNDNKKDIEESTIKFIKNFIFENKLTTKDILLVIIVAPNNLKSSYPCSFLRINSFNFPCITASDIIIEDTPQNILRFLIQCKSFSKPKELYLYEAAFLKEKINRLLET